MFIICETISHIYNLSIMRPNIFWYYIIKVENIIIIKLRIDKIYTAGI